MDYSLIGSILTALVLSVALIGAVSMVFNWFSDQANKLSFLEQQVNRLNENYYKLSEKIK